MSIKIDIRPHDLVIVRQILNKYLASDTHVWVFGSRAKGTARRFSDLDLAVDAHQPLPLRTLTQLRDAFEESDLPYKVDIVDLHTVREDFRVLINQEKIYLTITSS